MRGRILIVDDEPQIRRVLSTVLVGHDYIVDSARSGEDALEQIRKALPDLVLLDMNMPGIGGLETLRKLIQIHPEIRVIVVTVHTLSLIHI